jgi:hypothetical protein
MNYQTMSIRELAMQIRMNWTNVYFGAKPYLQAMLSMESIHDKFGMDDGKGIIIYFLSNATTWRGPVAREIKKELNRRLKHG